MNGASKRAINAINAPQPVGGYAQALDVRGAGRLLFVSGQVPVRPDESVPTSFKDQARQAWSNVEAQLHAAGMDWDNLVKVTIFLSDRAHSLENREARLETLGDRQVALTVIIAGIFDTAWLLEIEAIAAA
jgi:2-iminobutanoate/2-iminopropanoate deaminase